MHEPEDHAGAAGSVFSDYALDDGVLTMKDPLYDPAAIDHEINARFDGLLLLGRVMAQNAFYGESIAECERIFATKDPTTVEQDCESQHLAAGEPKR